MPTHTEMADTVAELRAQVHNYYGTPLSATPQTVRTRVGSSLRRCLLGVAVAIGAVAGWCWRGRGMYAKTPPPTRSFKRFKPSNAHTQLQEEYVRTFFRRAPPPIQR